VLAGLFHFHDAGAAHAALLFLIGQAVGRMERAARAMPKPVALFRDRAVLRRTAARQPDRRGFDDYYGCASSPPTRIRVRAPVADEHLARRTAASRSIASINPRAAGSRRCSSFIPFAVLLIMRWRSERTFVEH
jgi:hypothetical protein